MAEKPFFEAEYKNEKGRLCPMVEILIGERKVPILAYADSGCTTGIFLLKDKVRNMDLGVKISDDDDPSRCIVADGHIVGADEYASTVYVNGERKEIIITVVDLEKKLGSIPVEEMTPLLGRNFMDSYDVLFRGKEKKLAIFYSR